MLREAAAPPRRDRAERRLETPTRPGGAAGDVFDALRAWRLAEAKAQSVPPYVIFHDSVLRDIAALRPTRLEELAAIKGVGASKLARYGAQVLETLRAVGHSEARA